MEDQAQQTNIEPVPRPGRFSKVLHFPLTRLILGLILVVGPVVLVASVLKHLRDALPAFRDLYMPVTVGLVVILTWVMYRLYVRWLEYRRPVTELEHRRFLGELGIGAAIGASVFVLIVGVLTILGYYRVDAVNHWTAVLPTLWISIQAGYFEEVVTRGLVFRVIEESLGTWIALMITALLFGFAHIFNPGATLLSSLSIALTAGVLLALVFVYTRRLWLAIGIHFAWNFTQGGIFGIAVSGADLGGLLSSRLDGPELLTGGAFGTEASLITVIVISIISLWFLQRVIRMDHVIQPFWRRRDERIEQTTIT